MAYQILGTVHVITATENLPTRNGGTLAKRTLVLKQRRFDQNTGEEFEPNYPTFEFTQRNAPKLDKFKVGDKVKVSFDINGFKFADKNTREEKYSSTLRGFNIEPYVTQQPQQQGYQQAPQGYAPQQGYQQPPYQPQQAYNPAPPQGGMPPQGQDNNNGLPF